MLFLWRDMMIMIDIKMNNEAISTCTMMHIINIHAYYTIDIVFLHG